MKVRILINLKKGVLDTPGKAIESSLVKNLGFSQISQVRQGKFVELEIVELRLIVGILRCDRDVGRIALVLERDGAVVARREQYGVAAPGIGKRLGQRVLGRNPEFGHGNFPLRDAVPTRTSSKAHLFSEALMNCRIEIILAVVG